MAITCGPAPTAKSTSVAPGEYEMMRFGASVKVTCVPVESVKV